MRPLAIPQQQTSHPLTTGHLETVWNHSTRNCQVHPFHLVHLTLLRCKLCFSGGYGISLPCCRICELPNLQKTQEQGEQSGPHFIDEEWGNALLEETYPDCVRQPAERSRAHGFIRKESFRISISLPLIEVMSTNGQCSDQLPLLDPELSTSERIHPPSARSQRCLHLRNHIFPHFQPSQCFLGGSG